MEVFVAILGCSLQTYVEAPLSQCKEDLITSCENALYYYGGVPQAIVPDNLKSAVTKASRYEPVINEEFDRFAEHYGMAVLPARVRKPKDKSHVENARLGEDGHHYSVPHIYIRKVLERNLHVDKTNKMCSGILNFARKVGGSRLAVACRLADSYGKHSFIEKRRQMRLYGMHDAFKTSLENTLKEQMTQDQFIFHLVCSEWDNRRNRSIERADLLILDDFGMQAFDVQSHGILMDIIEDRHQKRSTMITSQLPVKGPTVLWARAK